MVDFTETIENKMLRSTLMHILSGGKRIFRRFKDALSSDSQQLKRYYLFILPEITEAEKVRSEI
jgi:hypothetical protein